jgi:hypothetical protein
MKLSILGVIVGGVVDVSSSFILGLPLGIYVALKVPLEQRVGPHASETVSSAIWSRILAPWLNCRMRFHYLSD